MRIGDLLLSSGFISEQDLKAALLEQSASNAPIGQLLKLLKRLDDDQLELVLQAQRKILFASMPGDFAVASLKYARQHKLSFVQAVKQLSGQAATGGGQAATGSGQAATGSGQAATGSGQAATGSGQAATGEIPHDTSDTNISKVQRSRVQDFNPIPADSSLTSGADSGKQKEELKESNSKIAGSVPDLVAESDRAAAAQNWEEAISLLEQAKNCSQIPNDQNDILISIHCRLAAIYAKAKRNDQTRKTIAEVLDSIRGGRSLAPGLLTLLAAAAHLCSRNGITEEADKLYKVVMPKWAEILPFEVSHFSFCLRDAIACSRMLHPAKRQNLKIGELLTQSTLINQEQFNQSMKESKNKRRPLGRVLSECGFVTGKDLRNAMKVQLLCRSAVLPVEYAPFTVKAASFARPDASEFFEKLNLAPGSIVSSPAFLLDLVSKMDKLLLMEDELGLDNPEVAALADELGDICMKRREHAEAEALYRRAHAVLARGGDEQEPKLANTCQKLAKLLIDQKKYPEAELLLLQSMEIKSRLSGEQAPEYAEILFDVGYLYFCQASYEPAIAYLQSSWMIQCQDAGIDEKRNLLELLIKCFEQSGQDADAEVYREQLRSIRMGE